LKTIPKNEIKDEQNSVSPDRILVKDTDKISGSPSRILPTNTDKQLNHRLNWTNKNPEILSVFVGKIWGALPKFCSSLISFFCSSNFSVICFLFYLPC